MNNRYLLLITLIFGLVGQTAHGMSRATQNMTLLNKHIQSDFFKLHLKPRMDKILSDQIKKYHPEINPNNVKWFPSDHWHVDHNTNKIGIPDSFIRGNGKKDINVFHHEETHRQKEHILKQTQHIKRNPFSFLCHLIGFRQSFNDLSKKHEWEADGGVPNDPEILEDGMNYYNQLNEELRIKVNALLDADRPDEARLMTATTTHPSHAERASRFEERYNKLLLGYSVIDPDERKKQGIPPAILDHKRPCFIAEQLGYDKRYYATVATDMLPHFKPSIVGEYHAKKLAQFNYKYREAEVVKPLPVYTIE